MGFIIDVLIQGLLYGILAMGVMVSYEILDIPDLSVDGTYPLGIAVSAILITKGVNPWLALVFSAMAGGMAGMITGLLHVRFKISSLLSGILVMTGLYSVNLMITQGKSNIPLFQFDNIFSNRHLNTVNLPTIITNNYQLIVMIALCLVIKLLIDKLLETRFGYLLKVTGDNESLIEVLGHDLGSVKISGLAISNAIVAFSGGLAASVGRYFDITLGTGMVVLGLSSVILGSTIFRRFSLKKTTTAILGAIIYRFIIAVALRFNMNPQHLKLATVLIFIMAMILNNKVNGKEVGEV